MLDKVLIKNISSLFGIKTASFIIPLVTIPYLVRTLGVEGYGRLGFSLAIIQYFVLIVNYGFDFSATSSIAKSNNDKSIISNIFWNVIFIRIIIALIGVVVIFISSNFSSYIREMLPILLSCYLIVVGSALFPQWLFQGKEQLGLISTARIIMQLLTIPLFFIFVNDNNDIWEAGIINGIPLIGISIVAYFIIRKRNWIYWIKPSWLGVKYQLIDGWHIFISTAAISLYTTSVTIILGFFSGPISVGYFTAADKLIKASIGVYGTISSAFYPRINSEVAKNRFQAINLIKNFSKLLMAISISMSVIIFFVSNFLTDLFFGVDFQITANILKILAWLPFVISLSNILGVQILIPFGYKKLFSKMLIISGVISLVLLIPLTYFYSEYGAAISVLITEVIVTLLMGFAVYKTKILKLEKV